MRTLLTLAFLFVADLGFSQCAVLNHINDTIQLDGVTIYYTQRDTMVDVVYDLGHNPKTIPGLAFRCNQTYIPSVPHPVWKNQGFVCFRSGCGTSCFGHYLVPLSGRDTVLVGGDFLIDTNQTIFMSFYRDTTTYDPYLYLKNYSTGNSQRVNLSRKLIWTTIPMESLDYNSSHALGFHYQNHELTLYLSKEKAEGVNVKKIKVTI